MPTTSVVTPASACAAFVSTTVPPLTTVFPVSVVVAPSVSEPVPLFTTVLSVPPLTKIEPELTFAKPLRMPLKFNVPTPLSAPLKLLAPSALTSPLTPLNASGVLNCNGALSVNTPPPSDNVPAPSAAAELTFKLPPLNTIPPPSVLTPVSDTLIPEFNTTEPAPRRLLAITTDEPELPPMTSDAFAATFTEPLPSALPTPTLNAPALIVVPPE